MASDDTPFVLPARRLLKNLCAATKAFPPILFLELDSVNINRQIGRGGFADIFLGRYKGQDIALKRLQVYQPEPSEMLKFSKVCLMPFRYFQSQLNESTEPVAGSSHLGPSQTHLRLTIFGSRREILWWLSTLHRNTLYAQWYHKQLRKKSEWHASRQAGWPTCE